MWSKAALHYADLASVYSCVAVLALLIWRKELKQYSYLAILLLLRALTDGASVAFLFHRRDFGLSQSQAYAGYFYSYWPLVALQMAMQLLIIYSVYRVAMRPLDGLKRIGSVIFAWVATVSLILSVVVALGPHSSGFNMLSTLIGQVQQGVSVLTVCLLVFVCFAARPLGLDFRSRGFGVALGLGVNSVAGLVLSAWFSTSDGHSVYSPIFACGAIAAVATTMIWGAYFALPEPERKLVMLPTTSPYFLWNSISEAMGDNPGAVAIFGFTPAMLAPAERAALTSGLEIGTSLQPVAAPAIAVGF